MNAVTTVFLDQGPGNALGLEELHRLYRRLRALEQCPGVRVVLLKSSNPSVFSSGLRLRALLRGGRLRSAGAVIAAVCLSRRLNRLIMRSSKVYVSVLRGGVIGSAVSLALACDFVYADESAWFWLPDPIYGGLLADGGLDILRARCGWTASQSLGLLCERFGADRALECGMIHAIEPAGRLDDAVDGLAVRLERLSPDTLRRTKRLLNRGIRLRPPLGALLRAAMSADMLRRTRGMLRTGEGAHGLREAPPPDGTGQACRRDSPPAKEEKP